MLQCFCIVLHNCLGTEKIWHCRCQRLPMSSRLWNQVQQHVKNCQNWNESWKTHPITISFGFGFDDFLLYVLSVANFPKVPLLSLTMTSQSEELHVHASFSDKFSHTLLICSFPGGRNRCYLSLLLTTILLESTHFADALGERRGREGGWKGGEALLSS